MSILKSFQISRYKNYKITFLLLENDLNFKVKALMRPIDKLLLQAQDFKKMNKNPHAKVLM